VSAAIICSDEQAVTIQITITFEQSMLATEESIQAQLNEAGMLATAKVLEH